ncbi:hypothetical protein Q5752_002535 [Cryptotrichosporon argae]
MEKQPQEPLLPAPVPTPVPPPASKTRGAVRSLLALLAVLALCRLSPLSPLAPVTNQPTSTKPTCAQAKPLIPSADVHNVSTVWDAKDRIVEWHRGAIRVPTEVFDEMGAPGEDKRWDVFADFHAYLEKAYPLVHKNLKKTTVDTYGLVYEWFGSDNSLQPVFLTAHQDVVPVLPDTVYQWIEPPFNATYDGEWIWGRGSSDDKSGLTSIMAAIELLLESDFKPTRPVVLGFGHDEERGGMRGAPAIRDWLLEHYGKDSMAILVDEGGGMASAWGRTFGLPAVAEKGKYDLNMTVSTLGGHSSVPPVHTGIGLTALLIAQLERNPYPTRLEKASPIWGHLQCAAEFAPDMPSKLKKAVVKAEGGNERAFRSIPETLVEVGNGGSMSTGPGQGNIVRAILSTTQATDIISGGVKVNALPEVVTTIVNHRLDLASSIAELNARIFDTLLPVAKDLDLALEGYGRSYVPEHKAGTVYLGGCDFAEDLEPAPISPSSIDSPAWRLLAGTARGTWASRKSVSEDGSVVVLAEDEELIMAPSIMTGNTDTRRYWDLTRAIYRWRYFDAEEGAGAHTTNERVTADGMVEFTRFYQALILNADADRDL